MLRFAWSDLLNNLTQIGLTVSAAALVLFLLRKVLKKRYPARAMCIVWAVLALRLLVPVQLTLPDPPVQVTPRTTYISNVTLDAETIERAELPVYERDDEITTQNWVTNDQVQALREAAGGPGAFSIFDFGQILCLLWIAGIALFVCWQIYRYVPYCYVLQNSSHPAERDTLLAVFAEQKQSLGITRDIPLRVTPAADCPMLAGFVKPALYLPDEAFSAEDAAFIFRHELTHYKRGDLWLKLALVAARAVHWFNPLVHLMARFAQEDIELACDDAVVRGMDVAARRAYGETILRSVEAQAKKRALVSCFTGDKETLMRRFEGLFDKNVKKRGIALVVAAAVMVGTLGCAFSVGESSSRPTEEERLALAEQWAQSANLQYGHTVTLDGENTYVLYDHTSTVMWGDQVRQSVPTRICQQLFFEKDGGDWQISHAEQVAEDGVTSLDEFRLLYENDLGFPDFLMADWSDPLVDISEPNQAALNLLHLKTIGVSGGSAFDRTMGDYLWDVTAIFADHSEVTLTMVNQFDQGWLPQDFTYDVRQNARTAADLAGQYARGVTHKSGQYLYPILSAELQQAFRAQQQLPDGGFSWKYGGSSPSYQDYALVPTEDENRYLAVFQLYGGGATDYRSAQRITVGQVDGRTVITQIEPCDEWTWAVGTEAAQPVQDITKSDLFDLYYNSGLSWPTFPADATNFNGASLDTLTRVQDAVATVFDYFGATTEQVEGSEHVTAFQSWFTSEVLAENDTEATVRLSFVDGSPSVEVQMRKTGAYWLPVGLTGQTDDPSAAGTGDAAQTDYTITSTEYHNDTYGYTLTLPDCFVGQGYKKENVDGFVQFGLQNALPGITDNPTDGGVVMTLQVQATAALKAQFGEDWEANYPVPCKQLAERDGLTWYLTFASDVQYDPSNDAILAAYTEMSHAAYALGADAFALTEPDAEQMQARMTAYLQSAAPLDGAKQYAQAGGSLWIENSVTLVRGNAADVVFSLWDADNHPYRAVQSVQASSYGGYHIISREWKLDADAPTDSREKFELRYGNTLGMPEFDQTRVEALLADTGITALRDPGTAAEWIFGLTGGTAENIVVHPVTQRYSFTYRWPDGAVDFIMQGVTLGGAKQPVYLPIAFDGVGWVADPYTYMMCQESGDFSRCTVQALVWYLAQSDGAYTEGILAELDKRWQQDADEIEQAMKGADAAVQTLWQQHKAANPDLFGA